MKRNMYRTYGPYDAPVRGIIVGVLFVLVFSAFAPNELRAQSVSMPARASLFTLAGSTYVTADGNQLVCDLSDTGDSCRSAQNPQLLRGGFWPKGTRNPYIFSVGFHVLGLIPRAVSCADSLKLSMAQSDCFAWAGDTAGAEFGELLRHGADITGIYDSRSVVDLAAWPVAGSNATFPLISGIVTDTSIFADEYIGRRSVSERDTWAAYWDGDTVRTSGREHPMGILVEQRTMQWNYPAGSEATLFHVYKITNVTNNALFQQISERKYFDGENRLPDGGWRYENVYVTHFSDMDVGEFSSDNYLSAELPFDMYFAYKASFVDPGMAYPPTVYHAPFLTAPGLVGVSFLKTALNPATGREYGLTSMSAVTSGGGFNQASTVQRQWRHTSLNITASKGDGPCNQGLIGEIKAKKVCFLLQNRAEARGFIGSGPFTLEPGQSETFITATMVAAPVATPLITASAASDNKPGIPTLAPGCFSQPIRPIDVAAGWVTTRSCPASASALLDPVAVTTVEGSLLRKAQVARAMADTKFAAPVMAPAPPDFYLTPGNNRITVTWEPSATDVQGDPFWAMAGDSTNVLYDANYRRFDVEGYRIFRGTSATDLKLIAQFDKEGTTFTDSRCIANPAHETGAPCTTKADVPLSGSFIQYRTVQATTHFVEDADTAFANDLRAGVAQPLTDTRIPFAFIDTDVRNGFHYYYRVVAFDINSVISGPSSLVSTSQTKSAEPRSENGLAGVSMTIALSGRHALTIGEDPTIDPITGTFSGPAQPSDQLAAQLLVHAPQLLATGETHIVIDSILPAYYPTGTVALYHLSVAGHPVVLRMTNKTVSLEPGDAETRDTLLFHASDPDALARAAAKGQEASTFAASLEVSVTVDRPNWHSSHSDWAFKQPSFWSVDPPTTAWAGGSRWFTGANETAADPTGDVLRHGAIDGVRIFEPMPYLSRLFPTTNVPASVAPTMSPYSGLNSDFFRRFYNTTLGLTRAADVRLYWGAAGLDSVIDVTHDVPVTFSPNLRASYGFLGDGGHDGQLSYGDFYHIPGLAATPANEITRFSRDDPQPLAAQPVVLPVDVTGDLIADGTGFGLYINGEPWLFQGDVPMNTVWTLRTMNGVVAREPAGTYSFAATGRNPAVPGLRLTVDIEAAQTTRITARDLARVHTVPDPYYANSLFDSGSTGELQFVNLPPRATLRIYSLSGVLVRIIEHDDLTGGGTAKWDLTSRNGSRVATGVYMFHVSTPQGHEHIGRFTIVNSR